MLSVADEKMKICYVKKKQAYRERNITYFPDLFVQ